MTASFDRVGHRILVLGYLMLAGCACGCGPPPVGGDSPVTTQRLSGSRLVDIKRDVSWVFSESTVIIENEGQPLPADIVETLLSATSTCSRIEAIWGLNEEAGTLQLSQMTVDEELLERSVIIPIAPAGHVRVNLGDRQYNLFVHQDRAP